MNCAVRLKFTALMVPVLLMAALTSVAAMECKGADCTSCHTLTVAEASELLKKTGGTVRSIKPAPIKGLFELLMEKDGKQGLVYIDYSKKYLMQGFIVDFNNLVTAASHKDELPKFSNTSSVDVKKMPEKSAIVLGNRGGAQKLYVFTDPDCPYCRKLHPELKRLVKLMPDLAVYIMLYPLPAHPEAYDKARAVLTGRKTALLDKAFSGEPMTAVGSRDAVAELDAIINYARRNGISATPSIVLTDGSVLSGFRTAEELQAVLRGR